MRKRRVGFLGGTFDPIHIGHLHLALSLQEAHGLDEILISPTRQNPLKENPTTSIDHRLALSKMAIEAIPSFRLLQEKGTSLAPSYIIDTLSTLADPNQQLFLLLGEDLLPQLHLWKEIERIFTLAIPLVGSRHLAGSPEIRAAMDLVPIAFHSYFIHGITPIPLLEISSSQIRSRLRSHLYYDHLLPPGVGEYIRKHGLYQPGNVLS